MDRCRGDLRVLGNAADPGRFHDGRLSFSSATALALAVGDTTSVSRTPKDEQKPIPRFIGLAEYLCYKAARARDRHRGEAHGALPNPCSFFRANASISKATES